MSIDTIVIVTARVFGTSASALRSTTQSDHLQRIRAAAAYVAHARGYSPGAIAGALQRQTVATANTWLRRAESCKLNSDWSARVARVEAALDAAVLLETVDRQRRIIERLCALVEGATGAVPDLDVLARCDGEGVRRQERIV